MNIFEINGRIGELCNGVVNEETGEVEFTEEAMAELEKLTGERDSFIEYLIMATKNDDAFIRALEEEKDSIADRIAAAKKKKERRNEFIKSLLAGNKFVTPKVQATFRTTKNVVKYDIPEKDYKDFLIENELFQYLNKKEHYDISKTAIKEAIEKGEKVPGASLVDSVSMTIK